MVAFSAFFGLKATIRVIFGTMATIRFYGCGDACCALGVRTAVGWSVRAVAGQVRVASMR